MNYVAPTSPLSDCIVEPGNVSIQNGSDANDNLVKASNRGRKNPRPDEIGDSMKIRISNNLLRTNFSQQSQFHTFRIIRSDASYQRLILKALT